MGKYREIVETLWDSSDQERVLESMIIKMNGRRVSKKQAEELVGKSVLDKRIRDAKQTYQDDPLTAIEWMDGMEIEFKF